jgi:1,4-alpha-glucan branching enzyme/maltooligosyltrehalose trehalohydrolase
MNTFHHPMPFGAAVSATGVRFRLWAPDCRSVELCLEGPGERREVALERDDEGWYHAEVAGAAAGTRYRYRIDGEICVPDPASRFQPEDVHGPSEVVDPRAYVWKNPDWRGRPWEEAVFYELHVGTFSPEGTFEGVQRRLDELVDLGVTAIELMPVADFPGRWDWGYDGVSLFAPDSRYGRCESLKALIDAAHGRGMMVFLDVVYNHFGPEGNYLHCYAKRFFDSDRHTPWGAAISFDGPHSRPVRRFFIDNALYWLNEYRFDGLRLDAVHAIDDRSRKHVLDELAEQVQASVPADRAVHLVLENDHNQSRFLRRSAEGRPLAYVAQWNDDIHHAYHVLLTGENEGYYADYADDDGRHLARCLTEGFAWQGEPSRSRKGERRGEPSAHLPPTAFVCFMQNHDQIGNRAFGERLSSLADLEALSAAVSVFLLAPSPPLLFMGEEWGAPEPFLFFCDLGENLRDAVRDGRRREFAGFAAFHDPAARERIPDPTDPETFRRSVLDRAFQIRSPHKELRELYRGLLTLRQQEIVPLLRPAVPGGGTVRWQEGAAFVVDWRLVGGIRLALAANLGAGSVALASALPAGRVVYDNAADRPVDRLPRWSARWSIDDTGEQTE